MRIGIITFHTALNYGAVLQTYATFFTLKSLGCDVKVIDYRAAFNELRFAPKGISYFFNVRNLVNVFLRNGYQRFCKIPFDAFIKKYIETTKPYVQPENLKELNEQFDIFLSGSDQVWNLACTEGDDTYYLPFVEACSKRNAYAVSFGYTRIPKGKESKYTELIKGFNHISVREKAGVDIVRLLTGKEATLVLDPTLLLTCNHWKKMADCTMVPKENYLLMYLMSEDKELINFARMLAKRRNLEIIYINQRLFKMRDALNIKDISPEQWIGLFGNADSVVTNSFHGLAFAINFNKSFYVRYIKNSIANSRLETILDLLDLHNRRIGSVNFNYESDIDYTVVNAKLNNLRIKSMDYINVVLNDEK